MNRKTLLDFLFGQEQEPQLATPTISLDNDNLVIEEVPNAQYYDIYVDGVLKESIDVRPVFNNISLTISAHYGGGGIL